MSDRPSTPSFDSFPDTHPSSSSSHNGKGAKAAVPAFDSFPSTSSSSSVVKKSKDDNRDDDRGSDRKRKKTEADVFLKGLSKELKADSKQEKDSQRQHRDDRLGREEHEHRASDGRSKGKGKARDVVEDVLMKELGGVDTEYGENKRRKPYQFIQSSAIEESRPAASSSTSKATGTRNEATSNQNDRPNYYSSRRGDEANIRLGGLPQNMYRYRRLGGGKVVGLNEGLRITRESAHTGRGVEIGPLRRFRTPRYSDSKSAKHMLDRNTLRVSLAPPKPPVLGEARQEIQDPFSSRSDHVSFETESNLKDVGEDFEEEPDYRTITISPALPSRPEDEKSPFEALGISGGESESQYVSRRNIELDSMLRANPGNVNLWIEFVNWQDEIALSTLGSRSRKGIGRKLNKVERASTAEIKLDILKKAIKAQDGNEKNEKLLLKWLRIVQDVESSREVEKKWKETLEENPTATRLWIEYVGWRQTNGAGFDLDKVLEVFAECLATLTRRADQVGKGEDRDMIDSNMVYLFLRLCLMLRQAGHPERALAIFQAIIELNLFRPSSLQRPEAGQAPLTWRRTTISALETFWDFEASRIGEAGAKGWANTPERAEPLSELEPILPTPPSDSQLPDLELWATFEKQASRSMSRPARLNSSPKDPYRIVLFDDIRPFLFIVDSEDSKQQLVYAFLTFLGLPFVPPDFPTSTRFFTDAFIHSQFVERDDLVESFWPRKEQRRVLEIFGGEAMEPVRKSALEKPWDVPAKTMPCAVDTLFGNRQGWFTTIRQSDLNGADVDLSRNVLTSLLQVSPDVFLPLDFFAFESCQSPKQAVKLAKSILRTKRQALALWDGYARIERSRGKIDDARQVYITALSMSQSFPAEEQIDGPLLWRAWAEMEWEEARPQVAIKVLLAAAGVEGDLASLAHKVAVPPTPAQNLRARQFFTTQLEASFQPFATQSLVRNRNHLAFSFALFEYLHRSDLTSSVLEIFEQHLFRLENTGSKGSSEHEEAFQAYVKLVYRHSEKGKGFKPGVMRDILERAIKEFKNNSMFLALFYHNELRTKIQNRVRRMLEDLVLKEDPTSQGYLFAIFAEAHLDARSTNVWGVRNLFERAIEDPNTKSSPSIWTLYVDFELRNQEPERAKSLLTRSVQECPWCRDLYLMAFRPEFRTVITPYELRFHWLEAIVERGLRLRLDFLDFLKSPIEPRRSYLGDGAEDEAEGNDDHPPLEGDDGLMLIQTDAEKLLGEREALKPY